MNRGYRTAREPLRDCKFRQTLSFLAKRSGGKPNLRDKSFLTCLLWTHIPENAGFFAEPTEDALEEANSSRERGLRGEA